MGEILHLHILTEVGREGLRASTLANTTNILISSLRFATGLVASLSILRPLVISCGRLPAGHA